MICRIKNETIDTIFEDDLVDRLCEDSLNSVDKSFVHLMINAVKNAGEKYAKGDYYLPLLEKHYEGLE